MSDGTQVEGTEVDAETPQDRNFRVLREAKEALEAENRELRELRTRELLRDSGYDPASAQGKAIVYGLKAKGEPVTSSDGLAAFVEAEFPEWSHRSEANADVKARQVATDRIDSLRTQSTGDVPADIGTRIAEAEKAGDWFTAGQLKLAKMAGGG